MLVIDPDECIDCAVCIPGMPGQRHLRRRRFAAGPDAVRRINAELCESFRPSRTRRTPPPERTSGRTMKDKLQYLQREPSPLAERGRVKGQKDHLARCQRQRPNPAAPTAEPPQLAGRPSPRAARRARRTRDPEAMRGRVLAAAIKEFSTQATAAPGSSASAGAPGPWTGCCTTTSAARRACSAPCWRTHTKSSAPRSSNSSSPIPRPSPACASWWPSPGTTISSTPSSSACSTARTCTAASTCASRGG